MDNKKILDPGLCLRNRTNSNLWLYTEQTAPLEWVHLRPGECCDMPVELVWYTIGASVDEPSAIKAILAQVGFAFTALTAVFLMVLPDFTGLSKAGAAAILAYFGSGITTVAGIGIAGAALGVSNSSKMKCPGVYANKNIMDITATLIAKQKQPQGEVQVYDFRWENPPPNERNWKYRHENFDLVDIRSNRDFESLDPPVSSASVISEIADRVKEQSSYLGFIENNGKSTKFDHEIHTLGGDGGSWSESTFYPEYESMGDGTGCRIQGVRVAASKFIDGIQVRFKGSKHWSDVAGSKDAKSCGVFNGKPNEHNGNGGTLECTDGDYINKITVKHDKYICELTFFSAGGESIKVGGRDGDGQYFTEIGGKNMAWIGFGMAGDAWVDKMTFVIENIVPKPIKSA